MQIQCRSQCLAPKVLQRMPRCHALEDCLFTLICNGTNMFVLNLFLKCAIDGKSVQYIVNAAR